MKKLFNKVAIIGVGLMGGSLGLAIRQKKMAGTIVGYGRKRSNLLLAQKRKCIDQIASSFEKAVSNADLVILAGPVGATLAGLQTLRSCAQPGALVMDLGSSKSAIVRAAQKLPLSVNFIGAHPMTGTEKSGAGAALPGLYVDRLCFLTPGFRLSTQTLKQAVDFWKAIGSRVVLLSPEKHDAVLASTSHLPQVVSSLLMSTVAATLKSSELQDYSAGGLRDTTRLAASSPEMWADICISNRANLAKALKSFLKQGRHWHQLIQKGDHAALKKAFARAQSARRQLV